MADPTLELEFCEVAGSPWEGRVRVRFGGETSAPFHVRELLSSKERAELRWYLEEYMLFPEFGNVSRAEAVQARLAEYGGALWEQLARSDGAGTVSTWLGAVHAGGGGRLELRAAEQADEVAFRSPWELMRTGGAQGTLLHNLGVTLVRRSNRPLPRLGALDTSHGLRVLAVVCRPDEAGFLDPRYTPQAILDALRERPEVSVEFCRPPTLAALTDHLRIALEEGHPYHVVHYDGHGTTVDHEGGIGALCFEKEDGGLDLVRAPRFGDLMASYQVPLVVLEACRTSMQVFAQETVAGALLRQGVGSVLAMGYAVHVDMTRELMDAFYATLARGQALGAALRAGRERLRAKPHRRVEIRPDAEEVELQDWFVPQLYQGGEDPVLLTARPARRKRRITPEPLWSGFLGEPRAGFQGRGRELHRLERAIEAHRAVVLHAPGGMGKTALSREAAHWWVKTGLFPDGAVLVSFESAASPEAVVQQVGQALEGIDFLNRQDGAAWVESELKERRLLVVWDNFETALAAFGGDARALPELAEFARRWSAGKSRLLVACRDAETGLDAWPFALGELSEPEALFLLVRMLERVGVDRAQRERRGWTREALRPLFERTGGHPLALELLAPQIPVLGPAAVAEEMAELLAAAKQAHPEARNQSMAASLDFSIRHLSQEARAALPAVALLSGGCLETTARMVVGLEPNEWAALRTELERTGLLRARGPILLPHPVLAEVPGLEPSPEQATRLVSVVRQLCCQFDNSVRTEQVNDAIFALTSSEAVVRRSIELALHEEQIDWAWVLANSLRQFLHISGRGGESARLITMLHERAGSKKGELTRVAASLEREAAWTSALRRETDAAVEALERLLARLDAITRWDTRWDRSQTLATLARVYYGIVDQPAKALGPLKRSAELLEVLESEGFSDSRDRASVLGDYANALSKIGRFDEALAAAETSLHLARECKDPLAIVRGLGRIAQILQFDGRFNEAEERFHEVLKAAEQAGDAEAEGVTWQELGILALRRSQLEKASDSLRKALKAYQRSGNQYGQMQIFNSLGNVESQRDNLDAALAWYGRSLELARALQASEDEAIALNNRASVLADQSRNMADPARARVLLCEAIAADREALVIVKKRAIPQSLGSAHSRLASLLLHAGQFDEAEHHAREALAAREAIRDHETWRTLGILEHIATARGDAAAAADWRRRKEAASAEAAERAGAPALPAQLVTALLQDALLARAHGTPLDGQLRSRGADDSFLPGLTQTFPWLAAHLQALARPGAARPAADVPGPFAALVDQAWQAAFQ